MAEESQKSDCRRQARPLEQEAVRTTIVGGRPPGPGKSVGDIPRGIEVLVKKASVDPEFRHLLVEKRAEAAAEIDLLLEPAEVAILESTPAAQLESIIERTEVSQESRAAFLGRAAALMLAALGAGVVACSDRTPAPTGEVPDRPEAAATKTPTPKPTPTKTPTPSPPAPGTAGVRVQKPTPEPDQPEVLTIAGAVVRETTPKPTPTKTPEPTPLGIRPDRPTKPATEDSRPTRPPQSRGVQPDRPARLKKITQQIREMGER